MKIQEKRIQKVKELLLKYLLPDALKPEYDGMMAYELAKIIANEVNLVDLDEMAKEMNEQDGQFVSDKYQNLSLADDAFVQQEGTFADHLEEIKRY